MRKATKFGCHIIGSYLGIKILLLGLLVIGSWGINDKIDLLTPNWHNLVFYIKMPFHG